MISGDFRDFSLSWHRAFGAYWIFIFIRMMTVVEESDKSPVTGGCQIGPKMNGPGQFDTTTSLLAQAQLVDMYSCEVRLSYYSLLIPGSRSV